MNKNHKDCKIDIVKTISKSKFVSYKTCPKSLWLLLNKKEEYVEDQSASKQIREGKEVGNVAKGIFKDTIDVTTYKEDGSLDIEEMVGLTNRYLLDNKSTIAEASFSIDNMFCSVDLLHPVKDGYEIYEVKASTNIKKEYLIDAAYQKYILEKKGLHIVKTYIVYLNSGYHRKGELDLNQLFIKEQIDTDPIFLQILRDIEYDLSNINSLLSSKEEPQVILQTKCEECSFKDYCHKDIPVPSVLNINRLRGYDYFNRGIITYQDVINNGVKLNKRQKVQIEAYLNKKTTIIDKKGVKSFLKTLTYPIYHLDFETMQPAIPLSDNAWPYEQVPTQYSLHIEYGDGRLEHKEFLGDSLDPRREIAESLVRDIPDNVCVLAYNKEFECTRINELADLFPDLREHLLKISNNIRDLIIPFKSGNYYHIDMGGSNSIKYVLPALYPDDPELDYHALPVVHNGGEAMDIYPKMLIASPEEKERIRNGLLQYCCLDTLAMVKVLRKLFDIKN